MIVVGFPVVFIILIVVQVLTECVIDELPPLTIVNIFTLSSKVLWVKYMIHKVSTQDIEARQRRIMRIKATGYEAFMRHYVSNYFLDKSSDLLILRIPPGALGCSRNKANTI